MGTNCAPLVADLFLFCYERDFMLSLSDNNQADIIEAFNATSRYLDDLLNIDNPYFEQMVGQIYPTELQLNKANSSDTETPFLDLNLSITNGIVSSKIYDKRDDFSFEIVNFPFLDGDVPRSPSYGVYISQLIRFARVCSNVDDFNNTSLQCYSVLSDILVKNELCILLERGSNVLSTSEGFICVSPPSKLKIAVLFFVLSTKRPFRSVL